MGPWRLESPVTLQNPTEVEPQPRATEWDSPKRGLKQMCYNKNKPSRQVCLRCSQDWKPLSEMCILCQVFFSAILRDKYYLFLSCWWEDWGSEMLGTLVSPIGFEPWIWAWVWKVIKPMFYKPFPLCYFVFSFAWGYLLWTYPSVFLLHALSYSSDVTTFHVPSSQFFSFLLCL